MTAVVAEILLLGITAFGGFVVSEQVTSWEAIHASSRYQDAVSYCETNAWDEAHCDTGLPVRCPRGGVYAPLREVPGAFECATVPIH